MWFNFLVVGSPWWVLKVLEFPVPGVGGLAGWRTETDGLKKDTPDGARYRC